MIKSVKLVLVLFMVAVGTATYAQKELKYDLLDVKKSEVPRIENDESLVEIFVKGDIEGIEFDTNMEKPELYGTRDENGLTVYQLVFKPVEGADKWAVYIQLDGYPTLKLPQTRLKKKGITRYMLRIEGDGLDPVKLAYDRYMDMGRYQYKNNLYKDAEKSFITARETGYAKSNIEIDELIAKCISNIPSGFFVGANIMVDMSKSDDEDEIGIISYGADGGYIGKKGWGGYISGSISTPAFKNRDNYEHLTYDVNKNIVDSYGGTVEATGDTTISLTNATIGILFPISLRDEGMQVLGYLGYGMSQVEILRKIETSDSSGRSILDAYPEESMDNSYGTVDFGVKVMSATDKYIFTVGGKYIGDTKDGNTLDKSMFLLNIGLGYKLF